jgi:hypothetical protein
MLLLGHDQVQTEESQLFELLDDQSLPFIIFLLIKTVPLLAHEVDIVVTV